MVFLISINTITIYFYVINKQLHSYTTTIDKGCPKSLEEYLASDTLCPPPRSDHKDNNWSYSPEAICILSNSFDLPSLPDIKEIICK